MLLVTGTRALYVKRMFNVRLYGRLQQFFVRGLLMANINFKRALRTRAYKMLTHK